MTGLRTTDPRPTRRHPVVAGLLSLLVPGLGQWYGGKRRRAVVFAAITVLIVAAGLAAWSLGYTRLLELVVQPRLLWTLFGVNLAIGVFRLIAVADAYRTVPRRARSGWRNAVGVTVALALLVGTAAPHVVAGAYTVEAIDLLTSVFQDEVSAGADYVLTEVEGPYIVVYPPVYFPVPPRNIRPYIDPKPSGRFPLQDVQAPPPFHTEGLDDGRITILLAGGDAGPGRSGLRTDSMMVASLDTESGTAAIFSVPRDVYGVPLPKILAQSPAFLEYYDEECQCFLNRLNALHPVARKDGALFAGEVDRGMKALEVAMERLLDLPIDYYMLVDMAGFVDIVDALGGVTVSVRSPVATEVSPYEEGGEWIVIDLQPGRQTLTGAEALAYVRERKESSDYVRMQRQRCLLEALAAEASPTAMLRVFPKLSAAIKRSTKTNIPLGILPDLVSAAAELRSESITTVGFTPTYYIVMDEESGHPVPEVERIQRTVRNVMAGQAPPTRPTGGGEC